MDKSDLLNIFNREQRIELEEPDSEREVDGTVIRHISQTGGSGFVIYSHLDEDSAEAAITAQIERFERAGQDFEWKAYDYDPPGDLVERLRRRGFAIEEPEALLVLDLTARPPALDTPVPDSVRRITNPGEVDALVALESAVWGSGFGDLGEWLKRDLAERPETTRVYFSYAGGQPVSAAWMYFHPGTHFASLWGGSTLPEYRKQGHYSLLLAARAQEALAHGYTLLTVDASPMSRPILEKHGFQYLGMSTPCKWRSNTQHK